MSGSYAYRLAVLHKILALTVASWLPTPTDEADD